MPKIRYSADFRTAAVAQVLSRTSSIAQVAREVGCTVGTLHSWLKKCRQKTTPPTNKTSFVPVKIIDNQNHSVEIVLPNGITIRLTDATPHSIAELVHALVPC
jgi:transposase-like protein